MYLQKLLSGLEQISNRESHNLMDLVIRSLEYDSRQVRDGSLFFAIEGSITDGHLYLDEALKKGAVAVISERKTPLKFPVPWIRVNQTRLALAQMANKFCSQPSHQLRLAGITGTNGKTTTAYLLHSMLKQVSPALLVGTIHNQIGNKTLDSQLTTPESSDIQRILVKALQSGCETGVLEVSSHALASQRVFQCHFPIAVFTNLTQDHLDFHGNLESYFQTKCLLFDRHQNPGLTYAIINDDDPFGRRIDLPSQVKKISFGFSHKSQVHPSFYKTSLEGTQVKISLLDRRLNLSSTLLGEHNIYNILAAATAASVMGVTDRQIEAGVEELQNVPGRMEKIEIPHAFTVILDYAHSPHALESVLRFCQQLGQKRVICVFGCGGERDRAKRPLMGSIAVRHSDFVVVTSDNPRQEDPEKICREICQGIDKNLQNYEVIINRRQAIFRALDMAEKQDIVLVAGKGHETYQEIEGKRIHFDDRQVVKEIG